MDAKTMYDSLKPEQKGLIYSALLLIEGMIHTAYAANAISERDMANKHKYAEPKKEAAKA